MRSSRPARGRRDRTASVTGRRRFGESHLSAYRLYRRLGQERPMQIGVVLQGGGKPIEDGRAPRPVSVSLHPAATRQLSTGGGRADSPLRQGNLVSVDRVERLGQLALGSGQVSLGERSLGEPLAAKRQVRPLAGRRRESTQL